MDASALNLNELFNNLDVVEHITGFLDCKDQLTLARVCSQFHVIIVDYVWKCKYRQLEICFDTDDTYAINNSPRSWEEICVDQNCIDYEHKENRFFLDQSDVKEFLQLNRNTIENFSLICFNLKYAELDLDIALPNMTTLLLHGIPLSDNNLKYIARNCPHLEVLILWSCSNSEKQKMIIGQDIETRTLTQLTKLKSFVLKQPGSSRPSDEHVYKYEHLQDILETLKIKHIHLEEKIVYPLILTLYRNEIRRSGGIIRHERQKATAVAPDTRTNPCEELVIGSFQDTVNFVQFSDDFLQSYANLTNLTIEGDIGAMHDAFCIHRQFFKTAMARCKGLTKLKITYAKISNFIPIDTLTQLNLYECKALSWTNLTQILSEMNLISFATYRTYYRGKIEPIRVSKSLRHFEFDFPKRFLTGVFEQQFEHLTSFTWKNYHDDSTHDIASFFSELKDLELLVLETIDDGVFALNALRKIKIIFNINMSTILKLLRHNTLEMLIFSVIQDDIEDVEQFKATKTNLLHLNIYTTAFTAKIDFWLELLALNPKLTIVSRGLRLDSEENIFVKLVQSSKFPRKSFNVGGFTIGYADLKNNFEATMEKIKKIEKVVSTWSFGKNVVF
ncbi:uncharacterized protein LOC106086751 [Stomoxys calcitrans]|uniref:F-box domain-containing protein n=1 Tax=Stomoxys calcitrans TaxID=35570 RepID=A0A1I8P404_STOCA|nr:uncharacterized protein LOC106086751 [Stomoxys calcitrans]